MPRWSSELIFSGSNNSHPADLAACATKAVTKEQPAAPEPGSLFISGPTNSSPCGKKPVKLKLKLQINLELVLKPMPRMSPHSQQSNTLNYSSSSTFLLHQVKFCKYRILPPRATANQLLWPKQTCRRWEGRGKTDFFDTSKFFESHSEGK